LGDPQKHIVERGGHIFMVVDDDVAIGCCALIAEAPGVFELGKMTVNPAYRGRGLGRQLLAHTIEQAKALGAHTIVLASNSKLVDAVHLYEALGFRHLDGEKPHSPYARANVFMQLTL
jgi:N-acetylglutamate synthase-like GNAT family acetyltransferase